LWILQPGNGVTTLGPWGVTALFTAMVTSITGINVFSLGVTFNYLVSLFYKKPIRQGLFGKPFFKTPLDQQSAGWVSSMFLSLLSGDQFGLGLNGWEIERIWFPCGSADVLIGMQLAIYWLLCALEELSKRDPDETGYVAIIRLLV
jgi:hypothetical protein